MIDIDTVRCNGRINAHETLTNGEAEIFVGGFGSIGISMTKPLRLACSRWRRRRRRRRRGAEAAGGVGFGAGGVDDICDVEQFAGR